MVTADLRESGCERGGRAAILVKYESIFIEIALLGGMGLYTSWLHKMAGTSPAIGIEPNPLMRPVLAAQGPNSSPGGLVQLVANVINASGQLAACKRALPKYAQIRCRLLCEHG